MEIRKHRKYGRPPQELQVQHNCPSGGGDPSAMHVLHQRAHKRGEVFTFSPQAGCIDDQHRRGHELKMFFSSSVYKLKSLQASKTKLYSTPGETIFNPVSRTMPVVSRYLSQLRLTCCNHRSGLETSDNKLKC